MLSDVAVLAGVLVFAVVSLGLVTLCHPAAGELT